jgi:hypothetical protein
MIIFVAFDYSQALIAAASAFAALILVFQGKDFLNVLVDHS